MTTTTTKETAHNVVLYGESGYDLPNGKTIRLREEPDHDTRINDWDCYGKVEHLNGYGSRNRPQHFTGMAEIVRTHSEQYWWQPPCTDKEDVSRWYSDSEYRNTLRNTVREILDFGFQTYVLEICEGEDAYGNPIVQDYTTLGGIEPLVSNETKEDYVYDMMFELGITQ